MAAKKKSMPALTGAQILAADDLKLSRVETPEWRGHVFVRPMTAGERDAFDLFVTEHRGRAKIRAYIVSLCTVDANGVRLFSEDACHAPDGKAPAPMTPVQVGGSADLLYRARTADELTAAVRAARDTSTPYFVLGRGANILVGDGGFRGLIIHSAVEGIDFLDGDRVRAGAGVDTYPDLIEATVSRGLGGLHHFVGIPSSVGGALWQNLHFLSPAPERGRPALRCHDRARGRLSCT